MVDVDWIFLAQDSDGLMWRQQWIFWFNKMRGIPWLAWGTVSLERSTLLYGVSASRIALIDGKFLKSCFWFEFRMTYAVEPVTVTLIKCLKSSSSALRILRLIHGNIKVQFIHHRENNLLPSQRPLSQYCVRKGRLIIVGVVRNT